MEDDHENAKLLNSTAISTSADSQVPDTIRCPSQSTVTQSTKRTFI